MTEDLGAHFFAVHSINWMISVGSLMFALITWKKSEYNKFNGFTVIQFIASILSDSIRLISFTVYGMDWLVVSVATPWVIGTMLQNTATFVNNGLLAYRLKVFKQVARIPDWVEKSLGAFIIFIFLVGLIGNSIVIIGGQPVYQIASILHFSFYIFYVINSTGIAITAISLLVKFSGQASQYQGEKGLQLAKYKKIQTRKAIALLVTASVLLFLIGFISFTLIESYPILDAFASLMLRLVFINHIIYNTIVKSIISKK